VEFGWQQKEIKTIFKEHNCLQKICRKYFRKNYEERIRVILSFDENFPLAKKIFSDFFSRFAKQKNTVRYYFLLKNVFKIQIEICF
jgi:hypothetical protein